MNVVFSELVMAAACVNVSVKVVLTVRIVFAATYMVICRQGPPESKTTIRDAPSNNGTASGLAQGSCPVVRLDGNPVKLFVPFTTSEVTSAMSV